ncbi:MAG TPA: YegS/Rv2252/BmrU family lipid kinase [Micromonosporaceae bacterium]
MEAQAASAGPVAVLANPTAGRGRHRGLLPAVLDRLGAGGHPVQLLAAESGAEAEVACREAVAGGAHALITVGGDGTVHRALQAVAGTDVAFGVVPAGTGNDFAAELSTPDRPLAAADELAAALHTGATRRVDLARIGGTAGDPRWFGAVFAAGFDAIVNERANGMRFPRGPRKYDLAILIELARLRPRRYTLRLDGEARALDAVLVAVGNGSRYGGGMRICPTAEITDGLLDVVVAGRVGRLELTRIKPRVYEGTHVDHPKVETFRARTVGVEAEGITAYADGERTGPLPVTITCVPGALRVLRT